MAQRYGHVETVLSRHETWKKGFHRLLAILGVAIIAVLISVVMSFWALSKKPEPVYFAAREDGGILPIVAVREPFLTDNQVINFTTEAITRAMTLNFANWRQDLADATSYFTRPEGWDAYVRSINESGMMDYIVTRRLIASTVANGAVITQRGANERGVYSWILQVPLTVTYQSSSDTQTENLLAEIEVVRVPTWEMSRGVGVRRVTMKRGN